MSTQLRRTFLKYCLAAGSSIFMSVPYGGATGLAIPDIWFMPEESELHKRTWMAFIASYDIWAERQVPEVQRNLALIAKTIAKYEPVSILVREQDYSDALKLLGGAGQS